MHEGDGHVDVELRNHSFSSEDEGEVLLGVGCAEEDGGDVLRGNGGIEGEGAAWETGGGDGKGETARGAEVVDVCGSL